MQLPQTFEEFDQTMKQLSAKGVSKQDQQRFAETWKFKMSQQGKDPVQMFKEWSSQPKAPLGPDLPKEIAEQREKEPPKPQPVSMIASQDEYIKRGNEAMTLTPEKKEQAAKDYPLAADIAEAARNAPGDAWGLAKDTIKAMENPIHTFQDIGKMTSGAFPTVLRKLGVPEEFVQRYNAAAKDMYSYDENAEANLRAKLTGGEVIETVDSGMNNEEMFNQMKEMVSETLQDKEKLKQVVIENPVETALFFAGLLTGGSKTKLGKKLMEKGSEVVEDTTKKAGLLLDQGKESVNQFMSKGDEILQSARTKAGSLFTRPVKTVDDVIAQADEALSAPKVELPAAIKGQDAPSAAEIRKLAEDNAPKISIREKYAGVSPDLKARIEGKPDMMKEYFDITHARNSSDRVPSPLEYAVEKGAMPARDEIQRLLNSDGGKIGKFREMTAKTPIPDGGMVTIRNEFINELRKYNLTTNNAGEIVQATNKVKRASDSEIKLMQSLYDNLNTVRANPTMGNLIDLRDGFGDLANYAKTSGEASSNIDSFVKKMRATVRDVNLQAIPAEQAKLLDDYSNLMEAFKEIDNAINSKSGVEFLLKRVLSERGREARQLFETVAEYTGIDLMDHATMAMIAREVVGNPRTKGLFQQEITNAGLNILGSAMTGNPIGGIVGAATSLLKKIPDKLADAEKMFMKAAEGKKKVKTPKEPSIP